MQTLRSFSAFADGTTDDTSCILAAFASGERLDGEGLTYAVSGNIEIPDNLYLSCAKFKQLDPQQSTKTLYAQNKANITLDRVTVDRGSDMAAGDISLSAGMWFKNIAGLALLRPEVTGHGRGAGIYLNAISNLEISRPYVHDMRFSGTSINEGIFGIWIYSCQGFTLERPYIENLDNINNQIVRPFQTDGITIGACSDFTIDGAVVKNVMEGIDLTGSEGNTRFSLVNCRAMNCDAFGFKFANSASHGYISGCTAVNTGWLGFCISGATEPNIPACENLLFYGCRSFNAGYNGNWATTTRHPAGFGVLLGNQSTSLPRGVVYDLCYASDGQGSSATMRYGFLNESGSAVGFRNSTSIGHTSGSATGAFNYV